MLIHFFTFPLFVFAAISIGLSFSAALMRIIRSHDQLDVDPGIKGFVGIFAFGMLAVIYNFFAPLDSVLFFLLVAALVLSGAIIVSRNKLRPTNVEVGSLLIISAVVAPLAGSLGPDYDGGLYHLPVQHWLRNEPIVIGLANLHGRFGFGSIYEYVAAPLWLGTQFTLLSYLQASFLVFFLVFLIRQAERVRGIHLTLLVAVAINVLIFNSYFKIAYTYSDLPAGLTFASAFLYGHSLLFQEKHVSRWQWAVFALLCLFAVLLKLSSAVLFLWCVFVVIFRLAKRKDPVHELLLGITFPGLLFVVYLIRNVISTGCLLYPLAPSCLDVPWAAGANAQNDANWITAWARHPGSGLYSLQDSGWFLGYWIQAYDSFLFKLLMAGTTVLAFYILFAFLLRTHPRWSNDARFLASFFFMLVSLGFWFYHAPDPRFGIGVFVLWFPVVLSFLHVDRQPEARTLVRPTRAALVLLVISISFLIGAPHNRLGLHNALRFNPLVVPTPAVVPETPYGVRPLEGDQCWLVPECAPYERPEKTELYGRTLFYGK